MNKLTTILLIASCLTSFTTIGQDFSNYTVQPAAEVTSGSLGKKLQLVQFDFSLGVDNDHYESMSLDHMLLFAKNPQDLKRNLDGFEEEIEPVASGVALYANFSFSPLDKKNGKYKDNREWRFGVGLHAPKEAMVTYQSKAMDSSIVFCNLHGELTAEAAYLMKGLWGKRFHWYLGLGANLGASFSNEMMLIPGKYYGPDAHPSEQESFETNMESYEGKSVFYSRIYVPFGLHYRITKNWQLGFDFKRGVGMQVISGENPVFLKRTGVFAIGAKYKIG